MILKPYCLLKKTGKEEKGRKIIFNKYFSEEMTKLLHSNMKFYKRIVDNDKLRKQLKTSLFDLVYYEYFKSKKEKDSKDNIIDGG